VFYGSDYLSVAKDESEEWDKMKPKVTSVIDGYFEDKKPILVDDAILGTINLM